MLVQQADRQANKTLLTQVLNVNSMATVNMGVYKPTEMGKYSSKGKALKKKTSPIEPMYRTHGARHKLAQKVREAKQEFDRKSN